MHSETAAVHHAQLALEYFAVGDGGEHLGVRVLLRVGGVNAVHSGGLQQDVRADLDGAQRGSGVRRQEGIARAAGQEDDLPGLQVCDASLRLEGVHHAGDGEGAVMRCRAADLLQAMAKHQRVDDGGEHAGVVGQYAALAGRAECRAAHDVAAPDDDGDLGACPAGGGQFRGDEAEGPLVERSRAGAGEHAAAQLQHHALRRRVAIHP